MLKKYVFEMNNYIIQSISLLFKKNSADIARLKSYINGKLMLKFGFVFY